MLGIGNEGLFLQRDEVYEGFFFAKSLARVSMVVALRNYRDGAILARQTIAVGPDKSWQRYNFSLLLNAKEGAACEGIAPGSDPNVDCHIMESGITWAVPPDSRQGHACIRCAGEFVIGLSAPGSVHVDYVFLQPGPWGRYGRGPFSKRGVDALKMMGITTIRLGGSFAKPAFYFWKEWRGPPWERQSLGAKWGSELISGFGPFEFIDMCAEAGIEPIVSTAAQDGACCDPAEMADLIEYTWGNESTTWGKRRIDDGHPEPYPLRYIELGNEQGNTDFAVQVKAMEERAAQIGKQDFFLYVSPDSGSWLPSDEADAVERLGLGTRVLSDMHVGAVSGRWDSNSCHAQGSLHKYTARLDCTPSTQRMTPLAGVGRRRDGR